MAATTEFAPPSPAVSGEAVEKAIKALLKWKDCQPNSDKPQLLSSDEFVYLVVTVKSIPPKSRTNPYKIPLVHPLFSPSDGSELCLFLDDRPDRLPTSKDAKAKISGEGIPIPKVIKLTKLKTDYKPFEAKRKLCDSYDLFLADRRIIPLLPKHLGKHFFKKRKIPVAVDLEHKNWKEQVGRICSSAFLHLKTGTCSTVRVARSSMSAKDIVENVVAAINGVADTVPRKWSNLRSLHLKLPGSVALPVYQSLPEAVNLIKEGALVEEGKKKKKRVREEGEDVLSSKKSPRASSKKGRIHQVRYMDDDSASQDVVGGAEEDKNGQVKVKKAKKKDAVKEKKVGKEASKDEPVKADGAKKAKKEAIKDEPVKTDGAKKAKKVKMVASKDELVKTDDLKKENKVRKVSNVAKSGSAKKSRRS